MPSTPVNQHLNAARDYSHAAIWRIAAPMIFSSVSTPLVGLVDTALMGHQASPDYLGAVAAGAMIFSVLFMSLNFLRMGTTGVAAQAYGSDNRLAIVRSLVQPLSLALGAALLLIALQRPVIGLSLQLLGTSGPTAGLTDLYFSIRVWGSLPALANFVIIGWLLGMQNARGPLAITLTINVTNLLLDLLLVLGLGFAVAGVAWATVCAEVAGVVVGLVFVRAELADRGLNWDPGALKDTAMYRRFFSINSNLFVRSMALMFTFAFITAQGARIGVVTLAANAILMNFQLFLSYALDGIAHAAEALTGKAAGARDREGLQVAVRRTLFWSLLLAGAFTMVYGLAGAGIINAMTDLDEVRQFAYAYLPWIVALPLISAGSFLYDGVFVGTTRSREMRIVMTGSMLLVFLPVWYVSQPLLNHGLWLAFVSFMAIRSLAMHLWYRRLDNNNQLVAAVS